MDEHILFNKMKLPVLNIQEIFLEMDPTYFLISIQELDILSYKNHKYNLQDFLEPYILNIIYTRDRIHDMTCHSTPCFEL